MPWRLRRSCHLAQLALQLARPSRPNSVHKRPETARRGHFYRFVYTIASPCVTTGRLARRNSVHKRPNPVRRGPILPFVYTIAIPRPPTTQAHGATVYTNAPIRRGEARSSHLCTLLRSQGHPQPKPTAQQCTQMPRNGPEGPFPPICVHCCVVALVVRPTSPVR